MSINTGLQKSFRFPTMRSCSYEGLNLKNKVEVIEQEKISMEDLKKRKTSDDEDHKRMKSVAEENIFSVIYEKDSDNDSGEEVSL